MSSDIFKRMGQRAFGGTAPAAKRACSPPAATAPKRGPAAPTTNGLSQGQQNTTDATNDDGASKRERVPPIYLDDVSDWPSHAAKIEAQCSGPLDFFYRGNGYRVNTSSVADFRAAQRYLLGAKVPFHTFTLRGGRSLKVVLTGLPPIEAVQLDDALAEEGFAVLDVAHMKSARGGFSKTWLVTLLPDCERESGCTKKAADIYSLDTLFHVRIGVSVYKKRRAEPPQCYHCQRFGHGSSNCGRPMRCVRCGGAHNKLRCPLPKDRQGVCCNCGGSHNANYRGCIAYKDALAAEKQSARKSAAKPQKKRPEPERPPPARTTEPAPAKAPAEDEEGFLQPKSRRRKRKQRNPANRTPKEKAAADKPGKSKGPEETSSPPEPKESPRRPRRSEGPPSAQDTRPAMEEEPPAQAATPAGPTSDVTAILAEVLRQLTALTGLLTAALDALRSSLA